jgi:hypothetical protein
LIDEIPTSSVFEKSRMSAAVVPMMLTGAKPPELISSMPERKLMPIVTLLAVATILS